MADHKRRTLLELQEHKGYGEDEGEREAALDAIVDEPEIEGEGGTDG